MNLKILSKHRLLWEWVEVFDVIAGFTKRAPLWMQKYGLEWLFRLAQEPRRMWRRYIIGNAKFIAIILRQKIGIYKNPFEKANC